MKTVKVHNGFVEGRIKSVLNKNIVEFLCVPYGKSPINELRFDKPQKLESFSNCVINKSHFETFVPQLFLRIFNDTNENNDQWLTQDNQSEDCLYLNIWCPLDILNGTGKTQVLVWINGGCFMTCNSSLSLYNGSVLSSQENIIVVSINYRLGIFGFLCLDEDLVIGNQGLRDQILALEWIHENITVFNGDSDNITIAGNSAGSSSVSLHLLMDKSWKFFNKAIMQSGVCLSDWSILPKHEIYQRSETIINVILNKFHYPMKWYNSVAIHIKQSILKFLQSIDFRDMLLDSEMYSWIHQCAWTPVIDGELILDDPKMLFSNGRYHNCPMIFTNSKNAGSLFILYEYPEINADVDNNVDFKLFNGLFKYYPYFPIECSNIIKENVKEEYDIKNNEKISIEILDEIITDQHIQCNIIELANIISKTNVQIYYLSFETKALYGYWPDWCGVIHADEVYYLFGHPLIEDLDCQHTNYKASKKLMSLYGQFMRNGIMNKDLPSYNEKSRNYISIRGNDWNIETFTEDKFQKVKFWSNLRKQFD